MLPYLLQVIALIWAGGGLSIAGRPRIGDTTPMRTTARCTLAPEAASGSRPAQNPVLARPPGRSEEAEARRGIPAVS